MQNRIFQFSLILLFLCSSSACVPVARAKKTEARSQKSALIEAKRHYLLGVDAYTNDHYVTAISEWKQCLDLVPHYENAEDYIERAEHMKKAIHKAKQAAK